MKTIYKFPLEITDYSTLRTHDKAKVMHVGEQGGQLCIWLEVDLTQVVATHGFYIRGTGHVITGEEGQFLGTVLMPNGLVWHIYLEDK